MKQLTRLLLAGFFLAVLVVSCNEEDTKVTLKDSVTGNTLNALPSDNIVLLEDDENDSVEFSWTAPDFGFNASVAYSLQADVVGANFANAWEVASIQGGALSYKTTVKALNLKLLGKGFAADEGAALEFRVKSTINGKVDPVYSNVVDATITPYSTVPQPKYPVPAHLYLVGSAPPPPTWTNPVPVPSQEFTKTGPNTFSLVINLTGGGEYLLLPVNGDWGHKYNPPASGTSAAHDLFEPDAGGNNIPGPASDGLYRIDIDFVEGSWTVTSVASSPVPDNLFIVGDAPPPPTWMNPVPVPSQQFTHTTNGEYEITIALTGAKHYLMLPVNGSWDTKYAVADNSVANPFGDTFAKNAPSDIPGPPNDGTYKITANFFTMTYTVVEVP